MKIIPSLLLILLSVTVLRAQSNNASLLHVFEGEWVGLATAFFPRSSDHPKRIEKIEATGKKILKDTYIEIHSTWTQPNGDSRSLLTLWNYHVRKDSFQILYLYDNWPGRADYPLAYDSASRTFTGHDTYMARGNIPAEEKVEWIISADGNEIRSTEYNHLSTDPEGYWPKTFEFVLRRK